MQVEVSHEELARALKVASKTTSRRPTLPVLSGARLEVLDGQLTIATTDLEVTSRTTISQSYAGADSIDGVVVVPTLELAAAVKGKPAKGATVALKHDQEAGVLHVYAGAMVVALRTLEAEDFPTLNASDLGSLVTSSLELITAWATRVLPAAHDDEARPVLTAVSIERKGCELTAAATDSYRLHVYQATDHDHGDCSFLVPARALRLALDVAKIWKADAGALRYVTIASMSDPRYSSAGQVTFTIGRTVLSARCIEGEFPPWRNLVPTISSEHAVIEITDAAAVKTMLDMATDQTRRHHDGGPFRIEAHGPDVVGTIITQDVSTIELPLAGMRVRDGELAPAAYNARYLRDMVAANGEGTMHVRDGLKPALFGNGNGFSGLLMPVRSPA